MAPGPGPAAAAAPQTRLGTAASAGSAGSQGSSSSTARPHVMITHTMSTASSNDEDATVARATSELKEFLEQREGSALRAWLRHFDHNNDQRITQMEFSRGMRKMGYMGDVPHLFSVLDADHSGELSLEEIDIAQAMIWRRFRAWCVESFESVQDMLDQLGREPQSSRHRLAPEERVTMSQFSEGLRRAGWDEGFEDIIFASFDIDDVGYIEAQHLRWLEVEKRRQKRKENAKRRAAQETRARACNWKAAAIALADFRQFLKRKYGSYVRAWRSALSPDGSMVLQKNDLFKACAALGFQGDVRLLYKAFDKDDSGYISIEELDARSAELLAHFRLFVEEKFGSASAAFHALDRFNTKKIRQPEFLSNIRNFGFTHPAKLLFHGLDISGTKSIVEEDMLFLDRWRPPAFLVAPPNPQAAEEVKALLVKSFKNFLKAWRHVLDTDASNHCNYDEFEAACKKIGYHGDVAGAWRALDADLSGYITLHEIDSASSCTLKDFRRWCDAEFGGVRSAFGVFDTSGDNEVSYTEFRRSCRIYGFDGNVRQLFYALDCEKNGSLSMDEIGFLDDWEFHEGSELEGPSVTQSSMMSFSLLRSSTETVEYSTDGPGPAKYTLPTTMGAGPVMPMVHFSGAYSFRKRTQGLLPGLHKDNLEAPSPASYDGRLGLLATSPAKPAYGFGTARRPAAEAKILESMQPGPGHYSPARRRAPAVACTPRRPLRVHPLLREGPSLVHEVHSAR